MYVYLFVIFVWWPLRVRKFKCYVIINSWIKLEYTITSRPFYKINEIQNGILNACCSQGFPFAIFQLFHNNGFVKYFCFYFPFYIVMMDEPRFAQPIPNVTVAVGRDANLPCVVEHLGAYKVSYWSIRNFMKSNKQWWGLYSLFCALCNSQQYKQCILYTILCFISRANAKTKIKLCMRPLLNWMSGLILCWTLNKIVIQVIWTMHNAHHCNNGRSLFLLQFSFISVLCCAVLGWTELCCVY